MVLSAPGIEHPAQVKNIIFDFGGVICNIDFSLSEKKFRELGFSTFDSTYSVSEREDLFRKLESGKISPVEFRDILKRCFSRPVTDQEIDDAWNAMILDIPEPRVRLLEKVSKSYRIFILSNSNEIHYHKYRFEFQQKYGYSDFNALFEKAYFSFEMHLQKPGREVFEHVLASSGLIPGETLFIDDSIQHVEGARKTGMLAYHLRASEGEQILDLFGPHQI
jgi:putative hydrolase of the HAD superfamily